MRTTTQATAETTAARPSLNETLAALGFTTKPGAGLYAKYILRGDDVVFAGRADEVWAWLRGGAQ
jgi:hypothetical protein